MDVQFICREALSLGPESEQRRQLTMLSSVFSRRIKGTMRAAAGLWLLATIGSFLFCFQGHPIEASAVVAPNYEGVLDGANCGDIGGWAWDANDPNNSITVDIYSDNVLVATVVADIFRQDLLDANKGNGAHGFDLSTPASLMNGQTHSIRVSIGGTNINLSNSPKTINCAGPVYEGFTMAPTATG
jgi:hypothetical protein